VILFTARFTRLTVFPPEADLVALDLLLNAGLFTAFFTVFFAARFVLFPPEAGLVALDFLTSFFFAGFFTGRFAGFLVFFAVFAFFFAIISFYSL